MIRRIAFAAFAAFFATFAIVSAASANAMQPLSGTWQLTREAQTHHIELHLWLDDGERHSMNWDDIGRFSATGLGLRDAQVDGAPARVAFSLHHDAGTFQFSGVLGNGRGTGPFTFTPNQTFVQGMAQRGLALNESRDVLTAAIVDLTLPYVDSIRAAGYSDLSYEKYVAFRAVGVTPQSIAELQSLFGRISSDEIESATAMHVTKAFVEEVRTMGIGTVTVERAITFKALGITKAYVAALARMGYPNLSPDNIVTFKAMHIDEAYINHLAAHGLKHLTAEQLIEMKATGL
jgi:predicted XRE-type DNA-binding protein